MRTTEIKFDFDDLLIIPKLRTNIASRYGEIDPYYVYHNGVNFPLRLPIITAPMDTVVSLENMTTFWKNNITVALPRTIGYDEIHDKFGEQYPFPQFTFISLGLNEMKEIINNIEKYDSLVGEFFILDVANGHMQEVYDTAQAFKEAFPSTKLMVGNIANPETFDWYARTGFVDFIRVGIGNGSGCLTTKKTSVGYPLASLIHECYQRKQNIIFEFGQQYSDNEQYKNKVNTLPLIVADGGMKDVSDIIKALALGADYVMVGSIFNKALESSGDNYLFNIKINDILAEKFYKWNMPVKKHFYGMSTKIAQKKMGKTVLKTSEGVVRKQKVEYTLPQWSENFKHYLLSAMSYSNARNLNEFIGKADFNLITENAFNRFNK